MAAVSFSVRYTDMIETPDELAAQFTDLTNPQVFMWFIGRKGLRQDWFTYLRDTLIATIRDVTEQRRFYLYDLKNWASLKKATTVVKTKVQKKIEKLDIPDIRGLDSAHFFQYLQGCDNTEVITYTNEVVWGREFIWEKSRSFDNCWKTLEGELGSCPLIDAIGDKDYKKAYSGLQYFEASWLVLQALEGLESERAELVFLLPNDEYTYYQDPDNSFATDVEEIALRSGIEITGEVHITFMPFKWGDNLKHRPYLSDDTHLNKAEIATLMRNDTGDDS